MALPQSGTGSVMFQRVLKKFDLTFPKRVSKSVHTRDAVERSEIYYNTLTPRAFSYFPQ